MDNRTLLIIFALPMLFLTIITIGLALISPPLFRELNGSGRDCLKTCNSIVLKYDPGTGVCECKP